jgi:hypothetical protein
VSFSLTGKKETLVSAMFLRNVPDICSRFVAARAGEQNFHAG